MAPNGHPIQVCHAGAPLLKIVEDWVQLSEHG